MAENEFQAWFLKRVKNDRFIVIGTNGNYLMNPEEENISQSENDLNVIYKQEISFSDFEHDIYCVYFDGNSQLIYLPSEH